MTSVCTFPKPTEANTVMLALVLVVPAILLYLVHAAQILQGHSKQNQTRAVLVETAEESFAPTAKRVALGGS